MQEPNEAVNSRNAQASISIIEQKILGLEEANRQAEMRSDIKTVANTWADDYVLTTPLGTVIEKAAILPRFSREPPRRNSSHTPKRISNCKFATTLRSRISGWWPKVNTPVPRSSTGGESPMFG